MRPASRGLGPYVSGDPPTGTMLNASTRSPPPSSTRSCSTEIVAATCTLSPAPSPPEAPPAPQPVTKANSRPTPSPSPLPPPRGPPPPPPGASPARSPTGPATGDEGQQQSHS